ncbi:MAG: transporter substrate-binding domain-containing protein [Lachnospiraceae bacterium]|jgi:cystine transport system substrate-binding protein
MRHKRFLAGLSAAILLTGMLAGCGTASGTADASASGTSASGDTTASASSSEGTDLLESIKSAGVMKVGVEGTYQPYNYHDDSGELVGLDVDIAKEIGSRLGVDVEFTETDWDSLLTSMDTGRIDVVISDVSISDEREEKYDFTDPYLYIYRYVVTLSTSDISSVEDLAGKKVATSLTNAFNPQWEAWGAEVVPVDTSEQALSLLASGRADFVAADDILFKTYQENFPEYDLKIALQIPSDVDGAVDRVAIPVLKGQTAFLDALNSALDEMRQDGTLSSICEKYLGEDYTQPREA